MIIQPVISENGGQEGNWIALLCALIFALGALLLPYNSAQDEHPTLKPYQISITELTPQPLSMISELRIAYEEIIYSYQTNKTWLSVDELKQNWIAPFVEDKSWVYKGMHNWTLIAPGVYQSKPLQVGDRYLLNSQNNTLDIWIDFEHRSDSIHIENSSNAFKNLESVLIKAGWTQVVFSSHDDDSEHEH